MHVLLVCEKTQIRRNMKISNHKCYYCTPYSWEFFERFIDYRRGRYSPYHRGGNHAEPQRYYKEKKISKASRYLIKRGILDGVDLVNFIPEDYIYNE